MSTEKVQTKFTSQGQRIRSILFFQTKITFQLYTPNFLYHGFELGSRYAKLLALHKLLEILSPDSIAEVYTRAWLWQEPKGLPLLPTGREKQGKADGSSLCRAWCSTAFHNATNPLQSTATRISSQ